MGAQRFSVILADITKVFFGGAFSAAARLVSVAALAYLLSVDEFGQLLALIAVTEVVSKACEFGLNHTLVSLHAKYPDVAIGSLFYRSFRIKVVIAALVFLAAAFASGYAIEIIDITGTGFGHYLFAVFMGILLSIHTFSSSVFQAKRQFSKFAVLNASVNLLRAVLIGSFFIAGIDNFNALFLGFYLPVLVSLVLSTAFALTDIRKNSRAATVPTTKEILSFAFPLGIVSLASIIIQRLDYFLVSFLLGAYSLGIYGLASQAATVIPLINAAIVAALLPRVAALQDAKNLFAFRRRVINLLPAVVLAGVALASILPYLLEVVFDQKYMAATASLRILVIGFAVNMVFNQLALVLYALNRTRVLAIFLLAQLVGSVVLNLLLIPRFGIEGAAASAFLVRIAGVALMIGASKYMIEKLGNGRRAIF